MRPDKRCSVCGGSRKSSSAYCQLCTNAYHRWRKQNPDIKYPMYEFRELVKLNAEFGITDLDRIVPPRKPGRKLQGKPESGGQQVLLPGEHPTQCGCWICEGYTSYEAYVAAQ